MFFDFKDTIGTIAQIIQESNQEKWAGRIVIEIAVEDGKIVGRGIALQSLKPSQEHDEPCMDCLFCSAVEALDAAKKPKPDTDPKSFLMASTFRQGFPTSVTDYIVLMLDTNEGAVHV